MCRAVLRLRADRCYCSLTVYFAWCSTGGFVGIAATSSAVEAWPQPVAHAGHVSWSVDGRYLLARGDGQPHVLWIWDVPAARLAAVLLLCRWAAHSVTGSVEWLLPSPVARRHPDAVAADVRPLMLS